MTGFGRSGGTHYAAERYDSAFFQHFRGQSAFEAAAEFARRSEWQAVATLFTFSGDRTLPHRLAICSCFPETLPPFEYRSLLPECDPAGRVVFPWRQQRLRDPADWSESAEARAAVTADQELESRALDKFYSEETNNTWLPFRLQQPVGHPGLIFLHSPAHGSILITAAFSNDLMLKLDQKSSDTLSNDQFE